MKALRKGILYAIALLVALTVLALIGVNLFLRSPGVRESVAEAFEKRLGARVHYETISYLPWRGIKVHGVEMPHQEDIAALTEEPFFHADSIVATISIWSIANRPIQLGEVHVHHPRIVTIQVPSGTVAIPWSAPSEPTPMIVATNGLSKLSLTPPTTQEPLPPNPEVPQSAAPPSTATVQDPTPSTPDLPPTRKADSNTAPPAVESPSLSTPVRTPRFLLSKVTIDDADIILLGPAGNQPLVALEGMQSRLDVSSLLQQTSIAPGGMLGTFTLEHASVAKALSATNGQGELRMRNDGTLSVTGFQASSDGGTVEGNLIVAPRQRGLPFQVQLNAKGIAMRPMMSRATARLEFAKGTIDGNFEAQGFLTIPETWRGRGEGSMTDAALARNGLLESLGRYIGLREYVELEFHEASVNYVIHGPVAYFQDIHWRTDNLEFKGLGAVTMNRQVKLPARLYFSERVRAVLQRIEQQLPEQSARPIGQLEGREDFYRDFLIAGPLTQLRANFLGSDGRTFEELLEVIRTASEAEPGDQG